MRRLLFLLLFSMLLCIPQDAGAWGDLYLLYNKHWDCSHDGGDNGWSNVSSTNALKLTNSNGGVTAWTGELTVTNDDWDDGSGILYFRFAAQYCGWVSTGDAFPLATQQTVASRNDENNMTISRSLGYNKFKIDVVNTGDKDAWQVTITPVADEAITYTFYFDNTSTNYATPKVYAYNDDKVKAFGDWSGETFTNSTGNLYTKTVTYNAGEEIKLIPGTTQLIFNDNGNSDTQLNAGAFVNNKIYGGGAAKTVYFLTPFNDKTVKIWAWKDGETVDGFTGDGGARPTMTANGSITYKGATHYIYSYTFTGTEPAYLNIDEDGLNVVEGAAYESGKYYVYEKTTKTIKIINDASWTDVAIYTWNWGGTSDSEGRKFGAWPGTKISSYDDSKDFITVSEATTDGTTTYTVTISDYLRYYGDNLIINNYDNGSQKDKTLKDGITYNTEADQTFTVYFKKPDTWAATDKVYAYTYGDNTEGNWPGTEATAVRDDVYKWTYTGYLPQAIIFNRNAPNSTTNVDETPPITVRGSANNGKVFTLDGTETSKGTADTGEMATKLTGDGHDVIYQLNFGSFTAEGTIAAATAQLDYLKGKGVDVIWVMPIHPRGTVKAIGSSMPTRISRRG